MAKRTIDPLREVTEEEVLAAIQTRKAFLNDDAGVTATAARAAQRVVSAYIRQRERDVASTRKRLKSQGVDVDREIRRILSGNEKG